MRKKLKLIVFLLAVFLIGIKGVKAETVTITKRYVDNVWSFHYRNGSVWTYGKLQYDYADGKLVYCIQPDASINVTTYNVYPNFSVSGYSEDVRRQMELITYYGYGYPGHGSEKYFMATQELLWLFSNDESIKWTTGDTDTMPVIDVSSEKNEIMGLVAKHNVLPTFNGTTKEGKAKTNVEIVDNNYSLSNYNFSSDGVSIMIVGNRLVLNAPKIGTYRVDIKPKVNSNNFGAYVYNDFSVVTQMLASFGNPTSASGSFYLKINEVGVNIYKKDIDTNELITSNGIKVKIKNKDTNEEVGEYEFNNGKINLSLPKGKYVIEEISTTEPYSLNDEKIEFEIKDGSGEQNIDFYNKKVTGKININKTNEKNEKLKDIEFEIYDDNDNLVDNITTNEDGIALSKELPLGKYKVKELTTLYGYKKNDKVYDIELKYKDQNESIVTSDLDVINEKIKCLITYITVSGKEKVDADFNIYTKDGTLVYTGKTIDGKASIELEYGDYIIKEISVPNNYVLNDKEISFSVNDNVCNSTMSVDNDKVKMPITSRESNIGYIIILLINICGSLIVQKNN